MKKAIALAMTLMACVAFRVLAQRSGPNAKAVVDAALKAMGTSSLQSIQYSGTGSIYSTGQAYLSGGAWPRYTLKKYTMSVNYTVPAMRQEIVRVDDEKPPRGGGAGGYNPVTFQGGIRPVPGDIIQNQNIDARTEPGALDLWLSPHGFLKGAAANLSAAKTTTSRGKTTLSFTSGKYTVTGILNSQNLVEEVDLLRDVAYTGDTPIDAVYSNYRDFGGVKFPMHVVIKESGYTTLYLMVATVSPNSIPALEVRGAEAAAGRGGTPARPEPASEKIGEGVWFLTPGIEGSVLVEFNDYVVMLEAPGNDAYSMAAIAKAKNMLPNKPIRYVVNSHHHSDHAGGLRAYVAQGIPIITYESHKKYYEDQIFRNPHTINPDILPRAPKKPVIETVSDKRVITDGKMTLEIYLMKDQLHADGLLMFYIPKEKLLIQADTYAPRPGAPPLASPSPLTVNLVDNVSRLKLDVQRVAHIHGGINPYSDVLASAGR